MTARGGRHPFVALEGCDGAGKSTLRRLLDAELRRAGYPCTMIGQHAELDPETTRVIIDVREQRRPHPPGRVADAYFHDRRLHVRHNVVPALAHATVIADRSVYSDAVYQEVLYGIPADETLERHVRAGTALPDVVVYVRVDVHEALARIARRGRRRRHYERPADLRRVAQVFDRVLLGAPRRWPGRVIAFDNDGPARAGRVRDELVPALLDGSRPP